MQGLSAYYSFETWIIPSLSWILIWPILNGTFVLLLHWNVENINEMVLQKKKVM